MRKHRSTRVCSWDNGIGKTMVTGLFPILVLITFTLFSLNGNNYFYAQVSGLPDIKNSTVNILGPNATMVLSNITKNQTEYKTSFNQGLTLLNNGNYSQALTAFERAISIDPNHVAVWHNKGQTLDKLGRYNESLAAYDKALSIDPTSALTWSNKGAVLYELGRYNESLAAYDKALSIDPTNPNFQQNKNIVITHLASSTTANTNNVTRQITSNHSNTSATLNPSAERLSSQNSSVTPENTSRDDQLLIFANPKCGFTVHYLANWTLSTIDNCDIQFDVPDQSSNTTLEVQSTDDESRILDQIVSDAIDTAKQDTKNFNIVQSADITVNGIAAHLLVYTWHNKGESDTQKALEILMLKGNTSYDITYSPDVDEYDTYLPAAQEMINLFKITPVVTASSSDSVRGNESGSIHVPFHMPFN
jgi:tetratricopeptide (TPR) repeat protein